MSDREILTRFEKHRERFRQFQQQFANMVEAIHSMETMMNELEEEHGQLLILLESKSRSPRPGYSGRDSVVKSVVAGSATRLEADRKIQDGPKYHLRTEPYAKKPTVLPPAKGGVVLAKSRTEPCAKKPTVLPPAKGGFVLAKSKFAMKTIPPEANTAQADTPNGKKPWLPTKAVFNVYEDDEKRRERARHHFEMIQIALSYLPPLEFKPKITSTPQLEFDPKITSTPK
ncbi:uncharacterized protein LOC110681505 [Aedes aegypti]|uniref:Uncharacterized protein n=1 Tax=Aedes aegypti TaxID=7159 RepID=A0A6I8U6S5_AEDAE|nr:uncharacterized protein LOC110681505 [Aedes aegypti]